jgi:hypothetical protein
MDPVMAPNRAVWQQASQKHVREADVLLDQARARSSLAASELEVLRPLLASAPVVVHLQNGHGLDDTDLVAAGAKWAAGIDFTDRMPRPACEASPAADAATIHNRTICVRRPTRTGHEPTAPGRRSAHPGHCYRLAADNLRRRAALAATPADTQWPTSIERQRRLALKMAYIAY